MFREDGNKGRLQMLKPQALQINISMLTGEVQSFVLFTNMVPHMLAAQLFDANELEPFATLDNAVCVCV